MSRRSEYMAHKAGGTSFSTIILRIEEPSTLYRDRLLEESRPVVVSEGFFHRIFLFLQRICCRSKVQKSVDM